jgi:hypothetical protein
MEFVARLEHDEFCAAGRLISHQNRETRMKLALIASAFAISLVACATPGPADNYHPNIRPAQFIARVDNPWFPLVPGTRYVYSERHGSEPVVTDVVTVTSQTKTVLGVRCVVVHDQAKQGDRVLEDTYDWYAQDSEGNVWYFGEDTKAYDDKGRVSTEGSWEAGVNGAEPGIMMKANPVAGAAYRTEYYAGEAEDMAQVTGMVESVTVPAGRYAPSLETKEWSLLEPGSEQKWYARGVGFIRSVSEDGEVAELLTVSVVP